MAMDTVTSRPLQSFPLTRVPLGAATLSRASIAFVINSRDSICPGAFEEKSGALPLDPVQANSVHSLFMHQWRGREETGVLSNLCNRDQNLRGKPCYGHWCGLESVEPVHGTIEPRKVLGFVERSRSPCDVLWNPASHRRVVGAVLKKAGEREREYS